MSDNNDDKQLNKVHSDDLAKETKAKKTGSKKIKKEDDLKKLLEIAVDFKKQIKGIVDSDNKNNKEGKPAIKKLEHIDYVYDTLVNKHLQECLLDENILCEIKEWLEPLPDKSLPNAKVKKRLLEALKNMKIHKDHLLNSGIGKIVYFYSINYKETKEIRFLAEGLVKKWSHDAFKTEDDN